MKFVFNQLVVALSVSIPILVQAQTTIVEPGRIIIGEDATTIGDGISIGTEAESQFGSISVGDGSYSKENSVSIGNETYSFHDSIAVGNNGSSASVESISLGNNVNTMNRSIGIGKDLTVNGDGIGIGSGTVQSAGGPSILLGNQGYVEQRSIVVGNNSTASVDSISIGNNNNINGDSIGIGQNINILGNLAIGIGSNSSASTDGIAIGHSAKAEQNSVALGTFTIVNRTNEVGIGGRTLGGLADATANDQAVNLGQLNSIISSISPGVDPNAVLYTSTEGNQVNFKGSTGTELLNVRAGTLDTSGANVGQVKQALADANSYTDLRFDTLEQLIANLPPPPTGGTPGEGTNPNAITYDDSSGNVATLKGAGGTEIRNVKAGTANDSAVNVAQMNQAKQEAINTSNTYTDVKTAETLTKANTYTDKKSVETLAKANQYTDEQVKDKVAYDNDEGSTVTFKGQQGTELRNVRAGTTYDSAVNLQQLHQAQQNLQRYADEGDLRTLQQANIYTDKRFNELDKKVDGVAAMSAAQSNIIYNPYGSQYQLGLGVGASGGESAVSMKFMGATSDKRVIYSFGVSKATSGKATYGAGVNWSF